MVEDRGDPVCQALLRNRMDSILYDTYERDICRSVAHKLHRSRDDDPDVDDCVQETFKNAYQNLKSKSDDELSNLARNSGIIKWLHGIARNVIRDFWWRNIRRVLINRGEPEGDEETVLFVLVPLSQPEDDLEYDITDENASTPEDIVVARESTTEMYEIAKEMYEITKSAVEALPELYRKPLSLRFLAGDKLCSEAEISEKMGVAPGTVKAWISRALKKVRDYVVIKQYLKETDKSKLEENSTLASRYKKVLLLHFYERLQWNQIAVQCACGEDQAKKILHRGIELLLQLLGGEKRSKYEQ